MTALTDTTETLYAALYNAEGRFFCVMAADDSLLASSSLSDVLGYFEAGYRHAATRGSGFATGAALHMLQCRPSVIAFCGMDDLRDRVLGPVPHSVVRLSGAGPYGLALECHAAGAAAAWEAGAKPSLV